MCLITDVQVMCSLELWHGRQENGPLAYCHKVGRRGVASPASENVKTVLDALIDKAWAGELCNDTKWVCIKVPLKL